MATNHGTRGGYYAHRRYNDPPCEACRAAINEYVREYRQRKGLSRNRELEAARRAAVSALKAKFRDEYDEILEQVKQEMGIH